MVKLNNDWDQLLKDEFEKEYYLKLREFLKTQYFNSNIHTYPPMHDIFNSLKYTAFKDIKAVIIGQDPYHGKGQAHGLCFSVLKGVEAPPSLKNIFKELSEDLNIPMPSTGELTSWAKNGVLLLNTVLTVTEGRPNSHQNKGWETFTDRIISLLNTKTTPVVFLLWGANAKTKGRLITNPLHLKLETVHPSPLSAYNGFFGCRHFSKANDYLVKNGIEPIDWRLE